MQPVPGREHRVDERLGQVDPAAAGLEHPLDELVDLGLGEDHVGQLVASVAGDEDSTRLVHPDLLDLGIVQEDLERAEAGDAGDQLGDHGRRVGHRGDDTGQAPVVVGTHELLGDAAHAQHVELRVDPLTAYDGPHLLVEVGNEIDRGSARDFHGHAPVLPRNYRNEKPRVSSLWTTSPHRYQESTSAPSAVDFATPAWCSAEGAEDVLEGRGEQLQGRFTGGLTAQPAGSRLDSGPSSTRAHSAAGQIPQPCRHGTLPRA